MTEPLRFVKPVASGQLLWFTLGLVALLRLLTLGLYPLTDTTEARYAEVARKMAELGDWVTPWYDYGVPFWAKPPLSTWLTAASIECFGVNEFAARLPYFLLAALIAWLTWQWLAKRSRREAVLAVSLLSGTLVFFVASAAVMTDLAMVVGTTLAMRGFWAAFESPSPLAQVSSRMPAQVWLLFVGLGIGLLAKGPVAVVLTALPIGLWVLLTGNLAAAWKKIPWLKGTLLTLLIAAPWYALAELKTPGFLDYFFIGEHFKRFTVTGWAGDKYGTAHASVRGTIWLYALAACLPWTLLLPLLAFGRRAAQLKAGMQLGNTSPQAKALRQRSLYLLAWALAPCVFFTIAGNILWTYVLPALPAFAALAAAWLALDVRRQRVDAVVSGGLLAMALLVGGFFVKEQLQGSWKSAKAVVAAHQMQSLGTEPVFFIGDLPYSASFYSQGHAKVLTSNAVLATKLLALAAAAPGSQGAARFFVALNPDQAAAMPPEITALLQLQPLTNAGKGVYSLYLPRSSIR